MAEYTIQQVSQMTGLAPSALRFYEKELLLTEVRRDAGGRRRYTEQDLDWISVVLCLKNTDMPLGDIKQFVALHRAGDKTLGQRLAMVRAHQKSVQAKIDALNAYLQHINYKVAYYEEACRRGTERELKRLRSPEHIHSEACACSAQGEPAAAPAPEREA